MGFMGFAWRLPAEEGDAERVCCENHPRRATDPGTIMGMTTHQVEVLTWDLFEQASRELAGQVLDSGFWPDLILSITRGGLIPTGMISYALDIKNLHIINVEFYTGVNERLPLPVLLPPVPAAVDLSAKKVLIIDDVADTGETLKSVRDFCEAAVAETRVAVLYEKPHSVVKCDYVWRRTADWISFPWSAEPPLVGKHRD